MSSFGNRHKVGITVGIVVVIFVGLFIYLAVTAVTQIGKARVELSIAPSGAELLINDKKMQPGTLYLEPGRYTITLRKAGFETRTEQRIISTANENLRIPMSLIPVSKDAEAEMKAKNDEYLANEAIGGELAQAFGQEVREKNSIISYLPYRTSFYTIGYQNDSSDKSNTSIIVTIDANEGDRAKAVAQIERWGYDATTMNIQFRAYTNPFNRSTEEGGNE